jgi:hypothetical protein
MKVIDVPEDALEITKLLDQAREDAIVLRAADGTEYSLTLADDFNEEIRRTRANKELMAFLEQRAKEPATITLEEVKRELGLD